MAPKRKDKENDSIVKQKPDPIQVDNEIFLQAFEKPTQIYRYLRTRNMMLPIFLNRNLTYMKNRMSRTHKKRKSFKIDDILATVEAKERKLSGLILPDTYLSLMFMGFYDKQMEEVEQDQGKVKVDVILIKNAHNKRKETSAAIPTVIGSIDVMVNPNDISLGRSKIPAISISADQFDTNSPSPATHTLIFRIEHCPTNILTENGKDEPPLKKLKQNSKAFTVELTVSDKYKCLLEEGEYDLTVQEDVSNANLKYYSPKKHGLTWETFNVDYIDADDYSYDEVLKREPTLKFHLKWTKESVAGLVERPLPITCIESNKENQPNITNNNNNVNIVSKIQTEETPENIKIIYHFVYNNNSRQQTENTSDFHCPWCSLNCINLYALLKHLKLCHPRFVFTYVPIQDGARIDVSINELYDGSYNGSPHDLLKIGGSSRNAGPVRRSTVTNILVCRPRRTKPSLNEFLEIDENEFDSQRPYITGHNRLYHHTMTCLPVLPKELDIDSEGESDPSWLKQKTMQMIDEFTDVNEGEKELMKMWNLHVMKFGYVGDCQIPLACDMFVEHRGKELVEKNLYRNCILHMCSLFDFGLISPENFYTTVQKLQKILNESEEARTKMHQRNEEQAEYWKTTGIIKHMEQLKQAEEQKQKDLEEKKRIEDTKLVITATDIIKSNASTSTKTVFASVKTSTTTVLQNKTNGTANRDRKSLNHNLNNSSNNTRHSSGAVNNTRDRGVKRRVTDNSSEGSPQKRRRSAGSIQLSEVNKVGTAKITNRRQTLAVSRRRSVVSVTNTKNFTELLPKNGYPKIVLTRKSISGTNLTGGTSVKTRQSTGSTSNSK